MIINYIAVGLKSRKTSHRIWKTSPKGFFSGRNLFNNFTKQQHTQKMESSMNDVSSQKGINANASKYANILLNYPIINTSYRKAKQFLQKLSKYRSFSHNRYYSKTKAWFLLDKQCIFWNTNLQKIDQPYTLSTA